VTGCLLEKFGAMKFAVLCLILVTAPFPGHAQTGDIGKREYLNSCAICHGDSGKGDGLVAAFLNGPPSDLTVIRKNNMGVFPFDRIYAIIDGRTAIPAHGPRDMPVWGDRFKKYDAQQAELALRFGIHTDPEIFVHDRISALIRYISGLQVK
jgi:mono/diheme cytochrome c family protein